MLALPYVPSWRAKGKFYLYLLLQSCRTPNLACSVIVINNDQCILTYGTSYTC
jgi:hypothetical protein